MAPGGVTGVIMALVFIAGTDAFLLFMRYVHEAPPISLTFLIPVFVAAMLWGPLSAAITAIGGGMMITLFFNSPLYVTSPGSRSGILGITAFLAASLVLGYLASKTRSDAARALRRENEIRDLYTFRFAGRNLRGHAAALGNVGGPQGSALRLPWDAGGEIGAAWRR
jgi:K+-sensing histidine kinase KdpD